MGAESQMRRMGGRKGAKSPPILSHEFVIQNHADIMSCVAMVFVLGLMLKATNPIASIFVTLQHNVTRSDFVEGEATEDKPWLYTCGMKDIGAVFFYTIACIIAHAVLQEYVIDKLKSRVKLSKTKTAKFSESGQLAAFYLVSVIAGGYIISQNEYVFHFASLWEDYPGSHVTMTFLLKLFFIVQMAYWVHNYPEFYFQKVKREDMRYRAIYTTLYLALTIGAYCLNFTRVCLLMLVLHYSAELFYHIARIAHFIELSSAKALWRIWNAAFIAARLGCVVLAVLVFWYGLRLSEVPAVDLAAGNFNTAFIRLNCLLLVCGVQIWLGWNFIYAWLRRARDRMPPLKKRYELRHQAAKQKAAKKQAEEEITDLPEADQHARQVRQRK